MGSDSTVDIEKSSIKRFMSDDVYSRTFSFSEPDLCELNRCNNIATEFIEIVIPWEHRKSVCIFVAGADKRGEFKLLFYYLARCFTCYNIIKVDLDISGEIAYFDFDGDYHECRILNTDEIAWSRLVYDLFLELINTQHEVIMCVTGKKTVSISIENYEKLKRYGFAGDSLNSAISKLFKLADSLAGGVVD